MSSCTQGVGDSRNSEPYSPLSGFSSIESSRAPSRASNFDDENWPVINLSGGRPSWVEREVTLLCPLCSKGVVGREPKIILACEHFFHYACLMEKLKVKATCPFPSCDSPVDLPRIITIVETVNKKTCRFFKGFAVGATLVAVGTALCFYFLVYKKDDE